MAVAPFRAQRELFMSLLGVGLLFRCHRVIVTVRSPRNKMKTYHTMSVKPIKRDECRKTHLGPKSGTISCMTQPVSVAVRRGLSLQCCCVVVTVKSLDYSNENMSIKPKKKNWYKNLPGVKKRPHFVHSTIRLCRFLAWWQAYCCGRRKNNSHPFFLQVPSRSYSNITWLLITQLCWFRTCLSSSTATSAIAPICDMYSHYHNSTTPHYHCHSIVSPIWR